MAPLEVIVHEFEEPVSFAALLRRYRLAARLTQEELAARCGLGARSIQNLERGANLPHRETLQRLATFFDLAGEARARFEAAAQPLPRGPRAGRTQISRPEPAAGLDVVHLAAWRRNEPLATSVAPNEHLDRRTDHRGRDVPNNLPVQWTSFIGRERALLDVPRLMESSHLVTLTGAGGSGKTRLAQEVAREIAPDYPDGVWLVELAPLDDPALVPDAVAIALEVRGGPGQPILPTLLSSLRPRRLLLILDNCEHLLDACAHLADAILRSCPDVQILATSREALGITGEVGWLVPSLSLPPLDQPVSLAVVARCEAVRLFVDRAAAVQPVLTLTEQNAPIVAQICRRLDGIPLAIELAATRVKTLSLEHIAARLDHRFRLLTVGSRTALPRQQTLAATVDWSYDLLTAPERALFNRLSVFAGVFTLEAAEWVSGVRFQVSGEGTKGPDTRYLTPDTLDVLNLLSNLVSKSLVVPESGAGGVECYRLLETLRQYGRERLARADESEIFHQRHASYYLQLAEAAMPHLMGPEQLVYLAQLYLEWDNIRGAMHWYLEHRAVDQGLRLAAALEFPIWYRGLDTGEGHTWRTQLLAIPAEIIASAARTNALLWAGTAASCIGDIADVRRWLSQALAMAQEVGDDRVIGWAMHRASRFAGPDPERWYGATQWELADGALRHYRATGDQWGIAVALAWLGNLAFHQGELERARQLLAESLAAARSTAERHCIAFALRYYGEAMSAENDEEAWAYLTESSLLYRELGDVQGPAYVEYLFGRLACLHERYDVARQHYWAGLRSFKDLVWVEMIVRSLVGLAMVAAGQGRAERAYRLAAASAQQAAVASIVVSPIEQAELNRALVLAGQALDETRTASAWDTGQAMILEQAVAYALKDDAEAVTDLDR